MFLKTTGRVQVVEVINIDGDWCLVVDGDILAVFTDRPAARRFLLWKGKKHEANNPDR